MKYLFFIFIIFLNSALSISNNQIVSNPKGAVYDFTFQNNNNSPSSMEEKTYSKIDYEVNKILGNVPRTFYIGDCINNVCNLDAVDCIKNVDGSYTSPYFNRECFNVGNGRYQSSALSCNSNNKCGIASCKKYEKRSFIDFMPYLMHPIESNYPRNKLDGVDCIEQFEYDDGIATKHDVNLYEYTNKVSNSMTVYVNKTATITGGGSSKYGCPDNWGTTSCFVSTSFSVPSCTSGTMVKSPLSGFEYMYPNAYSFLCSSFGCPAGYIDNGTNCEITTTTLTCPNGYTETTGTETLKGDCKKLKNTYSYYTYQCKDSSWTLINNATDPGCIDDTFGGCINFDLETNNCKRSLNNCSTAEHITTCVDINCDLVENNNISYCLNEQCPQNNEIFEKNGKCYAKGCPNGTIEINGICMEQ